MEIFILSMECMLASQEGEYMLGVEEHDLQQIQYQTGVMWSTMRTIRQILSRTFRENVARWITKSGNRTLVLIPSNVGI